MSSAPQLITTVAGLREALEPARRAGLKIGLVPTMARCTKAISAWCGRAGPSAI